jgi:hypothetical protein
MELHQKINHYSGLHQRTLVGPGSREESAQNQHTGEISFQYPESSRCCQVLVTLGEQEVGRIRDLPGRLDILIVLIH